ncbi:MAG: alpha-amylase family glycosyl hydrolase [Bacteroidota bacterium]
MKDLLSKMSEIWERLYPGTAHDTLQAFVSRLDQAKEDISFPEQPEGWYKDAIVYSLYVDLFNKDFPGLEEKLDYLQELGVNCLWLLPILDSPGKDAGFDISDYRSIRPDLLGLSGDAPNEEKAEVFARFLQTAHKKGLRVIFDIAINHTSDQHTWFLESAKSKDNPFRDHYIWADDDKGYADARIIFKGLCESNWEQHGEQYFFHRFFEFQPDLNYRNPEVLLAMAENMIYWLKLGVDGFRADAIPYLWKEEGTDCENLTETHLVVKFFRASLDYVRPETLLLAEACQKPHEVIKYFGDGDECHAGYHFPLMPQMFKSLHMQHSAAVKTVLSKEVTPDIPEGSQWFTFLRCHDELSLELVYVTEEDRKYIHDNYCKKPEWDFRLGQGISARLSELFDKDPRRIALAYAMMLSLPGTPVIYYGDEFGKFNDQEYYNEMIKLTGKDDTRFLVRGRMNWEALEEDLAKQGSYASEVLAAVSHLVNTRKHHPIFGRGTMEMLEVLSPENKELPQLMGYLREWKGDRLLVILNLSETRQAIQLPYPGLKTCERDLLGQTVEIDKEKHSLIIPALAYHWFFV